jgi:type VI protein secretion system component VasA
MLFILPLLAFSQTTFAFTIPCPDCTSHTIRWVDCHDKVPEPLVPVLNLTDTTTNATLPSNLFCGEMDVPMDYTKPFDSVKNNITIGFAMNRPKKRPSGLIF